MCQGSLLFLPMQRFCAMATRSEFLMLSLLVIMALKEHFFFMKGKGVFTANPYKVLYSHRGFDGGFVGVVDQLEIFIFKFEDVFYIGVDFHLWQWVGRAGELEPDLFKMV